MFVSLSLLKERDSQVLLVKDQMVFPGEFIFCLSFLSDWLHRSELFVNAL